VTDSGALAPLTLFEYDHAPGSFCLMLSDRDMVAATEVFEEHGYEGGGYSWAGVARSAVRAHAPEIAEHVAFDPEAGTFVAYGGDLAALRHLGALLHRAFHDRATLTDLIRSGDPAWFD
jgi:hypothetical protein